MNKLACGAIGAALLATAMPASAADYIFDSAGDGYTITFNGFMNNSNNVIAGLSSSLNLSLLGGIGTNTLTFSYQLSNTSTVGGTSGRVSGFAFDSSPNATGGSVLNGEYNAIITSGGNYPNQIGNVEICLTGSNSCAGGGGGGSGAFVGLPAIGQFTLTYGSAVSSVTLNDFFVRYQGLNFGGGSATGSSITGAVPEPGTWLTMLLGMFGVAGAMRARRRGSFLSAFA